MSDKESIVSIRTKGKAGFESYQKMNPELTDEEYDEVREEISLAFGVSGDCIYFIPDRLIGNKRTQRAFSIIGLQNGKRYYIDGRTAHATLLLRLKNHYNIDFDIEGDNYWSIHGFLDPNGFQDNVLVQNKSKEVDRPIQWFVRYTTSSPMVEQGNQMPKSPIIIS